VLSNGKNHFVTLFHKLLIKSTYQSIIFAPISPITISVKFVLAKIISEHGRVELYLPIAHDQTNILSVDAAFTRNVAITQLLKICG
jgi:hypothetical protein